MLCPGQPVPSVEGRPPAVENATRSAAPGPFVATEPWHADHAMADFCGDCQGGSPTTADERAHDGLVEPLSHRGERCLPCHVDRPNICDRYLALSAASRLPGVVHEPQRPALQPPAALRANAQATSIRGRNAICAGAILVIGLAAAAYIAARERGASALRDRLRGIFRRSEWSAYAAGGLLGLVVTISLVAFQRRLSGNRAYQELAGPLGRALAPSSVYWTHVVQPNEHWNELVLAQRRSVRGRCLT